MSEKSFNQIQKADYKTSAVKSLFNKLLVYILILISYLPFWAIYIISDFFYMVLRYIVKYRKQIITENLKFAFPDKSEKEISKIRNRYYHNMCDLAVESVKLYSMKESELKERLLIQGTDMANYY